VTQAHAVSLKDPEQLYLDWEHAHWASQDVDLSRDPADWAALGDGERGLLYFALSSSTRFATCSSTPAYRTR